MLKRMTQTTSLLIAAAAIVSIVPAHAADYKKIDSKEGTIYEAVAYKDGKFYIDGNTKDEDTDGAYYLSNGNYTELENIDSGADVGDVYGDKYLSIDSGDYYVDLSNGQVTDEDLAEDNADDAATALRKKIKDKADDRYSDHAALKTDLTELTGAKFSKTWYKTTYGGFNVYTDVAGNYIDADYNLGKVKVETTKAATLTNTKDTEEGTKATVSNADVIGQDANYIYRTVTVKLESNAVINKVNGVSVTAIADPAKNPFTITNSGMTVEFTAIQKISKTQASDDIDGAKYAKTVTTYVLADEDGAKVAILGSSEKNIVDGKIVAYTFASGKVDAQTIELKTSNGKYYTDITEADEESAKAVDTDVNGNLWRLDGGYVYKFDNDEDWTKVYKVDGAMEKLSVYDKDNMVVWNQDDEVYSVIGAKETTEPTTPVVTRGWVKNADGTWSFNKADGTKTTGWVQDGSTWYFLNASGIMQTGWVKDGANWYFLNASGAMKTGWVKDGANWYYLKSSGAMATGWINDNGTWYYLNASGAMLSNTTVDGYKLNASGAWVK